MITSQGQGAKSHICFLIRALDSNCIADFQLGSARESLWFLERDDMVGSSVVTNRLKIFLDVYIPLMLRMPMVRVANAGWAGCLGEGDVSR